MDIGGEVSTVGYSPNGESLAAAGSDKSVCFFETSAYQVLLVYMYMHMTVHVQVHVHTL